MVALISHSCPSSFQLRLGLKCRKTSFLFLRVRFPEVDARRRCLRLVAAAAAGEPASEGAQGPSSWRSSNGPSDSFSGWAGEESDGVLGRRGCSEVGGIMGVGLAGIFFAVGITFASLSLASKRTGVKQQMEPLTTQQEILFVSDDQNDQVDPDGNEGSVSVSEKDSSHNFNSDSNKALQVPPGKVLVPAVVDWVQGQALAALKVLKVIEADVQPGDICTRREYARWLVYASSALSRNSISKVYPAMYIENVTELAFDDVKPEDPDFPSIQGLAEAGLISSKLSRSDSKVCPKEEHDPMLFYPESPTSRQDLVGWKMALERTRLPEVDGEILYRFSGYIDIDKINPSAWPALVADLSAGEHGIIQLAFGYTRLFQPGKPIIKAQAAIALATGDATEVVGEELARIEAESLANTAVAADTALVAQVEKDLNARFEEELAMEREKINAAERLAEEARLELEKLKKEREEENNTLLRGRAAVESEMELLSRLRNEVEEQLQCIMSNKMEMAFERDRVNKLLKEAESEKQAIFQLQYQLEIERKALSMARAWAEDEAKRGRLQATALEKAREPWERQGLEVVHEADAIAGTLLQLSDGKESSYSFVYGKASTNRAVNLVDRLKAMAVGIKGKSAIVIQKIVSL